MKGYSLNKPMHFSRPNRAAGFTLMEILVSVIVLSIGLLGVAGLQFNSLRGNQDALHASLAVMLVAEGTDRLRANVPGADAGAYDVIVGPSASDPGCTASACAPAALADHDAYEWVNKVRDGLPLGMGVICLDSTPDDGDGDGRHGTDPACDNLQSNGIDSYAVKVWWDHDGDGTPNQDGHTDLIGFSMSVIP